MDYDERRVGASILLVRGGKVLLLRRANTGWADGKLAMAGGHLHKGETARQGAVRELEEELGLSIDQDRLVFFATAVVRTNFEFVNQQFYVELQKNEEPVNAEPDKSTELVWCDPRDLPEETEEVFRYIITQGYLNKQAYLEIGY